MPAAGGHVDGLNMDRETTPGPQLPGVPMAARSEQSAAYFSGAAPREEKTSSVSVDKLHVPLFVYITSIVVACGAVLGFAAAWYHTTGHAATQLIHVPEAEVLHGGGVAYKNDIWSARTDFDAKLLEEDKRVRRLLRMMEITCRPKGNGMVCRVELPLDE